MRKISRRSGRGIRRMNRPSKRMSGTAGPTQMIPTSTRVSISSAAAVPANADGVAVFMAGKAEGIEERALSGAGRKTGGAVVSGGVARRQTQEGAGERVGGHGTKNRQW